MQRDSPTNPKVSVRSVEETTEVTATAQSQAQSALEFGSAEELVRHDRAQTAVPENLARRVERSLAEAPSARKPWWRRWF